MSDEDRRVAEALDPTSYAVHITKTAMLLEQMARDVSYLREKYEDNAREVVTMRTTISSMERETAVFRSDSTAKVNSLQKDLYDLTGRLTWLNRVVVGALVTGLIGIVFKFLER